MTGHIRNSLFFYYAGAVIVLALALGGGTAQGLWTDHLLQVVMLPALFLGLGRMSSSRLDLAGRLLVVLILVVLAVQFLPVLRPLPLADLPVGGGTATWSTAPHKSLESALFATGILGFFLYLTRFSDQDQERCLRFLFIGFFVNLVAGILELSYGQRAIVSDMLPFTIRAGLLTNDNHFSSLIYVMIPLLAYQLLARYRLVLLYVVFAFLIVGFQFAVGSRAGTAIAGSMALLSLLWFWTEKLSFALKLVLLGSWIASIVAVSLLLGFDAELENDLRAVFFRTTWEAIGDYLPFGSGLGTFTLVYPAYEAREDIAHIYANHAHNDYLELFLETGLMGMALVVSFFVLALRSFSRSQLAEAAFISVLALSLHSLVDYPLRTMTLAVVLAWLAAVIFSVRPFQAEREARRAAVEMLEEDHPRLRVAGAAFGEGVRTGMRASLAGKPAMRHPGIPPRASRAARSRKQGRA